MKLVRVDNYPTYAVGQDPPVPDCVSVGLTVGLHPAAKRGKRFLNGYVMAYLSKKEIWLWRKAK